MTIRLSINNTPSPREQRFLIRQTCFFGAYALLALAALLAMIFFGPPLVDSSPVAFGCALAVLAAGYFAGLITLITRTNRRQQQIRMEDGMDETLESLQPRSPSRRQQLWHVYGCLGVIAAGALSWIMIEAATTKDWLTAAVTVLFGAAVVLVGGHGWMRQPERWVRVIVPTVVLLGIFTLGVSLLHWDDWGLDCPGPGTRIEWWGLATISTLIGGFIWVRFPRPERSLGERREMKSILPVP